MAATEHTGDRARRARFEPLGAERIAPGMFEVSNLRSERIYRVDLRQNACECEDYQYTMGPANGDCKHLSYLKQISKGELCSHCGYAICRPSCPQRGER